jgi:hypothetical protein
MLNRREREELDKALDRVVAGDAGALPVAAYVRAGLMLEVPEDTIARHLAALARRSVTPALRPVRRARVRITIAGLAAAVVVALGGASAIAASSSALPGEPLYGLKRSVERVGLAMHRGDSSRAEFHLKLATRRLAEIQALIAAGLDASEASAAFEAELAAAESHTLSAQSLGQDTSALLEHIQAEFSKHIGRLTDLLVQVPAEAQDAIRHAIERTSKAEERVLEGRRGGGGKPSSPGRGSPPATPGASGAAPGHS